MPQITKLSTVLTLPAKKHEMCYAKRKDTARPAAEPKDFTNDNTAGIVTCCAVFWGPKNIPKCNSDSEKKTFLGQPSTLVTSSTKSNFRHQSSTISRTSKSKSCLEQKTHFATSPNALGVTNPPLNFSHREARLQSRPSIHSSPM